ncbi:lysine decarboxylase [Cryptococcus neoformans Tu401-1]|nr:lysine decarboxylase [Cryptococcus neoformans var. grubii Tu401-1]
MSPFPQTAKLNNPVCVFCGSSPGNKPLFVKASESVGKALAKANIPLVYGGGRRGIMGVVSQSTLSANGYVHGIVPRALVEPASEPTPAPWSTTNGDSARSKEGTGKDVVEGDNQDKLTVEVVGSMHERKLAMAKLSTGGFIVLPGGYGTLEEALEMITWNQLGIHRLPIIILNISNFFTHLYKQFENSVEAGFIAPNNLSLLRLVDLEGGEEANIDETRADEWGQAALKALKEWSVGEDVGYNLNWKEEGDGGAQDTFRSPSYIFTTMRCTIPSVASTSISAADLPLIGYHLERLREAHAHFAENDTHYWGEWPGDESVTDKCLQVLREKAKEGEGDYRVRIVIYPRGIVKVEVPPAPKDAGPFSLEIPTVSMARTRPLVLDPAVTDVRGEDPSNVKFRLYKTSQRELYDLAYERGSTLSPCHPEVLLHTSTHLLETTTSNVAILSPSGRWITPSVSSSTPLLNGVVRRFLLANGAIEEGELTLADFERVKAEGGRIIGFNGLRGVWEGEII